VNENELEKYFRDSASNGSDLNIASSQATQDHQQAA